MKINYVFHKPAGLSASRCAGIFTRDTAAHAMAFHRTFPDYRSTPLVSLDCLAREYGVGGVYIKDESFRFGLNAFKVLGGSYCIGSYIARRLGIDLADLPYERMISDEIASRLGSITFATATDGNHGRGVAWTANRLRQRSVVYMPGGSSAERLNNIRALGSEAAMTDVNYNETVRYTKKQAGINKWVLIQDSDGGGEPEIPVDIMRGYTTLALETLEQLDGIGPTHIILQAGVGSMAGALAAFYANCFAGNKPVIVIVEPDKADCFYRTALAGDGSIHTVDGDMDTIMAGLACGEPCGIAWDILNACADCFISMPDYVAAKGMRVLGNPLGTDSRVISGESGACSFGLVMTLLDDPGCAGLRDRLGLGAGSRVLCVSTEGATDLNNYRRIVWDGLYPTETGSRS
jgi:diaminopropionate ammonia-lyase